MYGTLISKLRGNCHVNFKEIVNEIYAIVRRVNVGYSTWTMGVTDQPTTRKSQHGDPISWHQWNADTEKTARDVESHFIDLGMKGGEGGRGNADYVYIF